MWGENSITLNSKKKKKKEGHLASKCSVPLSHPDSTPKQEIKES